MSFSEILNLLGSLGLFLVGMKVMSDALMDLAGNNMRRIMAGLTANRFSAALTGFLVTGLIQSSSATTLMVVSFVNAGLLQLSGAIGVIMGANIGTTITAWLIAVLGFKVSMIDISLPLMFVAFVFSMRDAKKSSTLGAFIFGFALLFIGLDFMKNAVPNLEASPALFELVQGVSGYGFWSLLIFAFLGTLLTLILQSSSATMAITLIAVSQGWLPFDAGCAIVLGENIGTTITANLAALVSGTNARRAALAHLIFNIIGVIWVLALFSPFVGLVANLSASLQGASPLTNPQDAPVGLAIFHTVFNIANTALLIGVVPRLTALVTRLLPEKPVPAEEIAGPLYLKKSALKYPQTAVYASLQETRRLYQEPVLDAILAGVNIPTSALEDTTDLSTLVASSRKVLTKDYEAVIRTRLDPIYRELIAFANKVHQKFTLEEQEARELRNIGFAARDALLTLGVVSQLKREVDRYMESDDANVRNAFDQLRTDLLQFLREVGRLDYSKGCDILDARLGDLERLAEARESRFISELNQLVADDSIDTEAAASLFNSVGMVRSISEGIVRAIRHVSDVASSYDAVGLELSAA